MTRLCQFSKIAARSSCHWTDCKAPTTYQAVDAHAPAFDRVQRPVCAGHARFLATQGFWIFPSGDDEATSLRPEQIVEMCP